MIHFKVGWGFYSLKKSDLSRNPQFYPTMMLVPVLVMGALIALLVGAHTSARTEREMRETEKGNDGGLLPRKKSWCEFDSTIAQQCLND